MKIVRKIVAVSAALVMLVGVPTAANATGYIRIGDKCYHDIGGILVQFPCPREVSENP